MPKRTAAGSLLEKNLRNADRWLEGALLIGKGREAAALIDLQNFVVAVGGAFHSDAIVELFFAVLAGEININRLFSGHGLVLDGGHPVGIAARVHGGDRLFELVERDMP